MQYEYLIYYNYCSFFFFFLILFFFFFFFANLIVFLYNFLKQIEVINYILFCFLKFIQIQKKKKKKKKKK